MKQVTIESIRVDSTYISFNIRMGERLVFKQYTHNNQIKSYRPVREKYLKKEMYDFAYSFTNRDDIQLLVSAYHFMIGRRRKPIWVTDNFNQ